MSTQKKLRVLRVIDNMFVGGAQGFLVNTCNSIDHDKFDVEICVLHGISRYQDQLKNVKVHVLAENKYYLWKIIPRLFFLVGSGNYDIVHLHLYFSKLLTRLVSLLLFKRKFKIIAHEHNFIEHEFGRLPVFPLIKRVERLLFAMTDVVLCNSRYIRSLYIEQLGYTPSKCIVISNFTKFDELDTLDKIDCEFLADKDRRARVVFGFLARLDKQKGVDVLIDAFGKFIGTDPANKDNILVIAGCGPEEAKIRAHIQKLALENNIYLTGEIRSGRGFFYRNIDCFILPSLFESFGKVLLEAMYCRVPIIASDIGGISEVLEGGRHGFLFESNNSDSLAKALSAFIKARAGSGQMLHDMTERSFDYVTSHFSEDTIVKNLESIYSGLAEKRDTQ